MHKQPLRQSPYSAPLLWRDGMPRARLGYRCTFRRQFCGLKRTCTENEPQKRNARICLLICQFDRRMAPITHKHPILHSLGCHIAVHHPLELLDSKLRQALLHPVLQPHVVTVLWVNQWRVGRLRPLNISRELHGPAKNSKLVRELLHLMHIVPVGSGWFGGRVASFGCQFSAGGRVALHPLDGILGIQILPHVNFGIW